MKKISNNFQVSNMNYTISNSRLTVTISDKGAELVSAINKDQKEFIWQADKSVWGRHAPILFPYVGRLKDDMLSLGGERVSGFKQHGFARDSIFNMKSQDKTKLIFELDSIDVETDYPYEWILRVIYILNENKLDIGYEIINKSDIEMYCGIGNHPAFVCPFLDNTSFDEYELEFDQPETLQRFPLENGLFNTAEEFCENSDTIKLSHNLFERDALIFKDVQSDTITLKHNSGVEIIKMSGIKKWPHLGLWTKPEPSAEFICIEPWQSHADTIKGERFEEKEGIIQIKPQHSWANSLSIEFLV